MHGGHHGCWRALLVMLGAAGAVPAAAGNPGGVLAAYALYTQNQDSGDTVTLARMVLDGAGQACLTVTGVSGLSARSNPDPANFPVTVCEGLYASASPVTIPGSTLTLPAIPSAPSRIAVFGDTGYESKQLDDPGWFFPELAAQAAAGRPDVVLHVGDYNYSGTPGEIDVDGHEVSVYDAGDNTTQGMCRIPGGYHGQNSAGSASPDTWAAWKADFFDAAQGLLSAAPFVFLRGNHELCSRAGIGWFYLLDGNSPLLGKYARQLACPAAGNPTPTVSTPPFLVHLASVNLLVLDSTNACDTGLLNLDDYINQFGLMKQLRHNAPAAAQTWLLSHRPLWGIDGRDAVGACGGDGGQYCTITQTLLAADAATRLSDGLDLVVSGHMHRFQVIDFADARRARQFIVGNGGVKLDSLHPKDTTTLKVDGHDATVMGLGEFGYMAFDLNGRRWYGVLEGVGGTTLMSCRSGRHPMCAD